MEMRRHSFEEKLEIIKEIQQGKSLRSLSKKYKIMIGHIIEWNRRYKLYGIDGLQSRNTCRRYTKEQKYEIIDEVLKNHVSLPQVAAYYDVGETTIRRWIKSSRSMPNIKKELPKKDLSSKKGSKVTSSANPEALDKLIKENMSLKIELALLKKVYALVAERESPNK